MSSEAPSNAAMAAMDSVVLEEEIDPNYVPQENEGQLITYN